MVTRKRFGYGAALLFLLGVVVSCTSILGIDTEYKENPCSTSEKLPPLSCGQGSCRIFSDACDGNGLPILECKPGAAKDTDTCGNGLDDDCDGSVDENDSGDCICSMQSGESQKACYTGAPATRDKGVCKDGIQTCQSGTWGPCSDDILPTVEINDGRDNDCDGEIDEGLSCEDGTQQYCYGDAEETIGKGPCKEGTQTCKNGTWDKCTGEVGPSIEICDGFDNDCDESVDDLDEVGSPCECNIGTMQDCYLNAMGEPIPCPPPGQLKGICHCGEQICEDGKWGPCLNALVASNTDICDGQDEDCNGSVDNIGLPNSVCVCLHGASETCYLGPTGTEGVGTCTPGMRSCLNGQWGMCMGQKLPTNEICDGLDNNCDGLIDEGVPGVGDPCFLPQYANTPCHAGTFKCKVGTTTPECVPNTEPGSVSETCNGIDDNCDGIKDNGFFCCPGDGQQSGNETDLDCGGSCVTKCVENQKCIVGIDCESGNCFNGICKSATCNDTVKNGGESDVDCGLVCPDKCLVGQSCEVDLDCVSNLCQQANKKCIQKPIGATCLANDECTMGFCVDNVCCDSSCNGVCQACTTQKKGTGMNGICGPIADNTDPDSECMADLPSSCQNTGVCVGGTCAKHPAGTPCQPAVCTGPNTEDQADTCDGSGACIPKLEKDCTPYACVGSACKASCITDGECAAGYYCNAPQCQIKIPPGGNCMLGSQCQTGNCVDGVCCYTSCMGTCLACNLPGTLGTCSPIDAGQDPASECNPGGCNGAGACQSGIGVSCTQNEKCVSGNCVDGVCCTTSCLGTCIACDIAGNLGTCVNIPANSDPANECPNGACDGLGACQGTTSTPCTQPSQCASGFCVDGYCCDTACSGQCQACSAALKGSGANGVCGPIGAGLDPGNECNPGACNGANACQGIDGTACTQSAQCVSGNCVDGVCCNSSCTGTCKACNVQNNVGTCVNIPANQDPGNECNPGSCDGLGACQLDNGELCTQSAQCVSGNCVDGVCCDAPCAGLCQACTTSLKGGGNNGECGPIANGTDPNNDCDQEAVSTCGKNGFCNGTGACAFYANGTVCQGATCTGPSTKANPDTCNGMGICQDGGTTSCNPYACNGGQCNSMCSNDLDCSSGNYCSAPMCTAKQAPGVACTAANQCLSGFCVDAVCCADACSAECKTCAPTGNPGTCTNIPPGQPDSSPSCQGVQVCNGSGQCTDTNGQPCTTGSECFSTQCADGYCCNSACTALCYACSQAKTGVTNGSCAPIPSGQDPDNECAGSANCNGMSGCTLLPPGSMCTTGAECGTGLCVDGRCCENACNGTCQACSAAKTGMANGVCAPVTTNTDPDNECAGGECNGMGACESGPGASCTVNTQCQSGACADNVCCNNACSGPCQACNLAGMQGTCSPIAPGQQDLCPMGFVCDAAGSCKKINSMSCTLPSECLSGNCIDTYCCNTACTGTCMACNVAGSPGTCTNVPEGQPDGACSGTQSCDGAGVCKSQNGQVCASGATCLSSYCIDGYCCDTDCAGLCVACSAAKKGAGANGACGNIANNSDPDGECMDDGPMTCKQNGFCNGAAQCAKYASGTVCVAAMCVGNTQHNTDTCDGSGVCMDGGTVDCGNYACIAAACKTMCAGDADCASTAYCTSGSCQPKQPVGSPCMGNNACANDQCVDGYCCDMPCTASCMACGLTGSLGTCSVVKDAEDPGTCSMTDACDGNGVCKKVNGQSCMMDGPDAGCLSGFCEDLVCCSIPSCGSCEACNVTGSLGTCASVINADDTDSCTPNKTCDGSGTCIDKLANGMPCSGNNNECTSGFCVDGYCCDESCNAECRMCNKTGSLGVCSPVTSADDPDTCDNTKTCDAAGNCKSLDGQICSVPADCLSNKCVDGVCCNAASCATCQACNIPTSLGSCATQPNNSFDPSAVPACIGPDYCKASTCAKPNGQTAASAAECQSGHFFDGVCCNSACNTTCKACNLPGSVGTCTDVPSGLADDTCTLYTFACSGSGTCVDSGGNRKGGQPCNDNAQCANNCQSAVCDCNNDTHCLATQWCNTSNNPNTCDWKKTGGTACSPNGANSQCLSGTCTSSVCTCSSDAHCASGNYCSTSTCTAKKALGVACGGNNQCLSNNCSTTCKCLVATDCAATEYCSAGACVAKKAKGTACSAHDQCTSGICWNLMTCL